MHFLQNVFMSVILCVYSTRFLMCFWWSFGCILCSWFSLFLVDFTWVSLQENFQCVFSNVLLSEVLKLVFSTRFCAVFFVRFFRCVHARFSNSFLEAYLMRVFSMCLQRFCALIYTSLRIFLKRVLGAFFDVVIFFLKCGYF